MKKKSLTKKTLTKPAPEPKKSLSKQTNRSTNSWDRLFTTDQLRAMPLKPVENAPAKYPQPHDKIVPGTHFRMHEGQIQSVVTVMPDGVHLSWTTCGGCLQRVTSCDCRKGFIHTAGIEWIYIRTLLWQAGIILSTTGMVDSTNPEVRSRGLFYYAAREKTPVWVPGEHKVFYDGPKKSLRKSLTRSGKAGKVLPGPSGRKTLKKAADRPTAPRKTLAELADMAEQRSKNLQEDFKAIASITTTNNGNNNGKKKLRKR